VLARAIASLTIYRLRLGKSSVTDIFLVRFCSTIRPSIQPSPRSRCANGTARSPSPKGVL
jgi:hypothetical protein